MVDINDRDFFVGILYSIEWGLFIIFRAGFWVFNCLSKQAEVEENHETWYQKLFLYVGGIGIVALRYFEWEWSYFPWHVPVLCWIGFAVAVLGAFIFLWVHMNLGTNWSGTVTKKVNHTLTTSGPYRMARHPMYTAMLFLVIGILLTTENWLISSLWVAIELYIFSRIPKEERLMVQLFGNQYITYRTQVGALFPCVLPGEWWKLQTDETYLEEGESFIN